MARRSTYRTASKNRHSVRTFSTNVADRMTPDAAEAMA